MKLTKNCPDCGEPMRKNARHRLGCPKLKRQDRRPGQVVIENAIVPQKLSTRETGLLFQRPTRRS